MDISRPAPHSSPPRKRTAPVQGLASGIAAWTLIGRAVAVPLLSAGAIEFEGSLACSASLDEQRRTALISETLGSGPKAVLKKSLSVNTPGVWSVTVIATNGSVPTWSGFHYDLLYTDLLYTPPAPSVANDGIDVNKPQVGGGLPDATIGAFPVCVGIWIFMSDILCVDFTQGIPADTVMSGLRVSVSTAFDLTVSSHSVQMSPSFALAEHNTIPSRPCWACCRWGLAALLARRSRRDARNRSYDLRAVSAL